MCCSVSNILQNRFYFILLFENRIYWNVHNFRTSKFAFQKRTKIHFLETGQSFSLSLIDLRLNWQFCAFILWHHQFLPSRVVHVSLGLAAAEAAQSRLLVGERAERLKCGEDGWKRHHFKWVMFVRDSLKAA